jgi:hypothetical protein
VVVTDVALTVPAVTVPVTPSEDAVAFASVVLPVTFNVPATFKVPVTEDEAATNPPKNSRVDVVNDPRAVTVASVSLKTVPAGQPVPFARQTAKPITVAVAKFPELAMIEEPVAELNESKPVEAKLVDVALWSDVSPVTLSAPATFNVPVTLDEAATKPPKNSSVVVVNDPRAVTL